MATQFAYNPITGQLDLVGGGSSASASGFITNPNAEIDTAGWNLYNNQGRAVPAGLINQDLTFTSTLVGGAGNGVEIEYIYNAAYPAATPNISVISSSYVQVQWNNGPTVANNPTATQLATAWNLVPAAVAVATIAITGVAARLQYITGAGFLANGGDTAPTTGTGGVVTGVTLARSTVNPIAGLASFVLFKDAANREGEGVSTDFAINNLDKGKTLQVSFSYSGSAGMSLGGASDIVAWIYDITNAVLIPVIPTRTLAGPTGTILTFTGTFSASSTSVLYRLIFHIATPNAVSWDFKFDEVNVTDTFATAVTQVPSLVLLNQPVSGAVTDHMCVMWRDGASQWIPATIAGACIPAFGTDKTQLGFATDIVGSTASIYIRGAMGGFSFGPFTGYDWYIDNIAGGISPLPSPFNDRYAIVGMAISSTVLNIQFDPHVDLIANGSGTPLKGGLLSNSAINDGTGDQVLAVGANGNTLVANSGSTLGLAWLPAVVAAAPFTYTLATRTLTIATATNAVAGVLSAADHTTYSGYAATIALKAPLASPTFTGGVIISTTTGALTLPKLTTTQETALTAVEGMLIYNTTLHKMRIRTASAWETVTSV